MRRSLQLVLGAFLVFAIFGVSKASAQITINMQETGGDVVFSYAGSLNITDLTVDDGSANPSHLIAPSSSRVLFGGAAVDIYDDLSGPLSYGVGTSTTASVTNTGDPFGMFLGTNFFVPDGYASGTAIAGSIVLDNTDFSTLGIDTSSAPYVWTVQNSAADTITLQVIPEPSSALLLAGLGAAFCMRRRRL